MIWVFNYTNDKFTYVSPSVYQMLGYLPEEVLKMDLRELISEEFLQQSEEMLTQRIKIFLKSSDTASPHTMEIQNIHKNGQKVWVESSLKYRYNSKKEIEIVGVSRNIEERKHTEKKVLYLSYHDQLTGLYNRRFYEEELRRLDTDRNLPITLVLADVNGLKLTNDAFGHLAGDELLVKSPCQQSVLAIRFYQFPLVRQRNRHQSRTWRTFLLKRKTPCTGASSTKAAA
jgi:PAS domain S-box-containing protein